MATLQVRLQDLATRIGTESKALRTLINGNQADLAALTFGTKANVVVALNELKVLIDAIGDAAIIDDGATALDTTWSSDKITDFVGDAITAVVNGAPGALDTLEELAAALGDDANFAANITALINNRVRWDAAQGLTAPQQLQARQNINAYGAVELGNPDTDLVPGFEAALV